jgi:hypothetical protein
METSALTAVSAGSTRNFVLAAVSDARSGARFPIRQKPLGPETILPPAASAGFYANIFADSCAASGDRSPATRTA